MTYVWLEKFFVKACAEYAIDLMYTGIWTEGARKMKSDEQMETQGSTRVPKWDWKYQEEQPDHLLLYGCAYHVVIDEKVVPAVKVSRRSSLIKCMSDVSL